MAIPRVQVVACGAAAKAAKAAAVASPQAPAEVAPAAEQPGPSMSVEGVIVLKQADAAKGVDYLRVEDATGRVYLMEVNATTAISGSAGPVSSEDLLEGVRVQASFPRGGTDTPVASAVTILAP